MRPLLPGELDVAARALLTVPMPERAAQIARIIERAQRAERYHRATGRFHPGDGNGSLASAARKRGVLPARTVCDGAYLAALKCVLDALLEIEAGEIRPRP